MIAQLDRREDRRARPVEQGAALGRHHEVDGGGELGLEVTLAAAAGVGPAEVHDASSCSRL